MSTTIKFTQYGQAPMPDHDKEDNTMPTHYALNISDLCDLKETDPIPVDFMVLPVINRGYTVNAEPKNLDGAAITMECDEERATAIIDILRTKYHKSKVRAYASKNRKTWKRL